MPVKDILILRHCEKAGDALDDPLTPRGAADAEALAEALAGQGIDAIYASPYRRSQETIAPFARRAGLEIVTDGRLAEWRISSTALADIAHVGPRVLAERDWRAPWSETVSECWARVEAALRDIAARGHRRPVIAAHGGILGIALAHMTDGFAAEHWATFRQPTAVAVRGRRWTRVFPVAEAA